MHVEFTTVGELVAVIYQEVMQAYENEAMAAIVTAYLIDDLMGTASGGMGA